MKESKFIELLNLYVDHEISADDAALLETEIQQNPQRRQTYRQYCQMQKACTELAAQFRSELPTVEAGQVVQFEAKTRLLSPFVVASGVLAAAACVALTLVVVNHWSAGIDSVATPALASVETRPPVLPAKVANLPELQPVFRAVAQDKSAIAKSGPAQFDWMTRVQFERVPAQSFRFDSVQSLPVDDLVFRSRRVFDVETEGAAFRFQR